MVAKVDTVSFEGLKLTQVEVQVQVAPGLPTFVIVGLADKSVTESKERVRSALSSIGLSLPAKRVTVNLAPADLAKVGSHYDLPIALGLLVAMKIIPQEIADKYLILGELSLDAKIVAVSGVLPVSIEAKAAGKGIICPQKSGMEAAWAGDIEVIAAPDLVSLINHLKGDKLLEKPKMRIDSHHTRYPDLRDIKGQETAKRALEIAAAGRHNMLMIGPPGSGKSMLSSRLIGILPPLDPEETLEVSIINSVAGMITEEGISTHRPYRTPHHSTSMAAMVGGGKRAYPGEISLAHKGVLFLDELPEFNRDVLESLRQPIESGQVTVARANSHITYPAEFQLISAMNPCRCGYMDDAERACTKVPKCGIEYQSKISGPLYDRIDIFIDVPALAPEDMMNDGTGERSSVVAERVAKARDLQKRRYKAAGKRYTTNSEADGEFLEHMIMLEEEGKKLLMQAVEKFKISMRGYNRVLRVSRTIADLANSEKVTKSHIAEAISYRQRGYR